MHFDKFYSDYFPFWGDLSLEDRERLCQTSSIVHFKKGEAVHRPKNFSGPYIIKNGKLRVYLLSDDGKEFTIYRLHSGDICLLSASCLLDNITFNVYVDAETDCDCYHLDVFVFDSICKRVLTMKNYLLEITVQRFSDVMWVIQQIVFMGMDRRLAIFLLNEIEANESDTISLTHDQLARHLGTAREVITRILKFLAVEGCLEVTRKGIIILDKKKLRDIAL